jgi:hypothetical protein
LVYPHDETGVSVYLLGDHVSQVQAWVSGPGESVQTASDLALSAEFVPNIADESTWPTSPIR